MRKITISAAALLLCAVSWGQNINPTVEVTNIYQGNPSEIHKPQAGMAIPDSLLRFDMDFNYEVFEKPYQGAYNFKPYQLAMKPDKDAYRGKMMYLRTGAGYSFHPQLDFAYSPEWTGPFQMSVYTNHRSYFGKYHTLTPVPYSGGPYVIESVPGASFGGYDAQTSLGIDGRYDFSGTMVTFGVGYEGLVTRDTLSRNSFDQAVFNVRVRSNRNDDKYVFYDVAFDGRFGGGSVGPGVLNEGLIRLNGNVGPVLGKGRSVLLGFDLESVTYYGYFKEKAGRFAVVPKYVMNGGNWDVSVGVKVDMPFGGAELSWARGVHSYRGNWIFPDIHASYSILDNVRIFASATGGSSLNTYSYLLGRNHFLTVNPLTIPMDNSIEDVNAKIGVKGNFDRTLQFELSGGAAVCENGLLDSGVPSADIFKRYSGYQSYDYLPSVDFADFTLVYADALMDFEYESFRLDAGLHFRHTALKEDSSLGLPLPKFSFDAKAVYDINSRVYAGIRMASSTARKGICMTPSSATTLKQEIKVPGYLDLGLLAGWQFNRKLGLWMESGNLLCQTIQRNLFYAEKGLWITAGITLSL